MEHKRESILHATLTLTAVNLIAQVTGLLCRIGISRLAGAEVMGVYQLLMPAYSVMSAVTISGLSVSVSALTGALTGRREFDGARRLVRRALRAFVVLWLLVAVPVVFCSDFLSTSCLGDARTQLSLVVLLPCLLLTGIENIQKHHFYGLGQVQLPAMVELGEQLVRTVGILLLLAAFPNLSVERRVGLIVAGMLLSEVFSATMLTLGRHRLPRYQGRSSSGVGKQLAATALPIGMAAVVGSTLSAINAVVIPDRLICSGVAADQATSVYGVMFGMTLPLLMLPTCFVGAMCTVLLPDLSCCLAQGQRSACRRAVGQGLEVCSLVLLPLLALLAVFGRTLGQLIFQDVRVGDGIVLLALSVGVSAWDGVLSSALNGAGAQRKNAAVGIGAGAAELLLTWVLAGRFGLLGCGWSMLLGGAGETAIRWCLCRRAVGLKKDDLLRVLLPTTAAALMGLSTHVLYQGLGRRGFPEMTAVAVSAAFGIGFYLLILWVEGVRGPKWNKGCKKC